MSAEAPSPHRPFLVPPKFPARQPHRVPPRAGGPAARPKVVAFLIRSGEERTTDIPDEKKRTAAIPDEENRTAIPDEEQPPDEAKERRAAMILAQEKQIEQIKRALAEIEQKEKEKAMHSNIASAAAKPAALPASADSQAEAERVFEDLQHLFETHADFAAAVRECQSSRELSPRASGSRTKNLFSSYYHNLLTLMILPYR